MRNRDVFVVAVRGLVYAVVVLAVLAVMCCSCTTTKYVPVETVRTEYKDNIQEIHTTDSVTNTRFVYVKGDTVLDYRVRIKWKEKIVRDSIYIKTDSIACHTPLKSRLPSGSR